MSHSSGRASGGDLDRHGEDEGLHGKRYRGGVRIGEWVFPTLITSSVLMPEERRARGHDLRIWRNRHEPGKVRLFAAAPSESVRHLQADE